MSVTDDIDIVSSHEWENETLLPKRLKLRIWEKIVIKIYFIKISQRLPIRLLYPSAPQWSFSSPPFPAAQT